MTFSIDNPPLRKPPGEQGLKAPWGKFIIQKLFKGTRAFLACWHQIVIFYNLRGTATPNQKLACFVLYLKIINTFLKNNRLICIL